MCRDLNEVHKITRDGGNTECQKKMNQAEKQCTVKGTKTLKKD